MSLVVQVDKLRNALIDNDKWRDTLTHKGMRLAARRDSKWSGSEVVRGLPGVGRMDRKAPEESNTFVVLARRLGYPPNAMTWWVSPGVSPGQPWTWKALDWDREGSAVVGSRAAKVK